MMSLRQIEVFRAVMVAGTVHGAAAILHVSQPGLSRLIRHVEDKLGVALFERRKGRLVPTVEARTLFEEIEPIYRQIEQMKAATDRIGRGEGQTLRIAASPSVGRYIVPMALARLAGDRPLMPTQLDILATDQVVDYLTWRHGEAVITIFPIDHSIVTSRAIGRGDIVCVLPKDHPLSEQPVVAIGDLARCNIIGFETSKPHGEVIDTIFAKAGETYRPHIVIRFAETACSLVEFGLGVALVDQFTTTGNIYPGLVVRPVMPSAGMTIYLNTNSLVASSVVLRRFEAALIQTIDALGLAPETR